MTDNDKNTAVHDSQHLGFLGIRKYFSVGVIKGAVDEAKELVTGFVSAVVHTQMAAGDQRIAHAPHPLDEAERVANKIKNDVVHPAGDMNLSHAPHPIAHLQNNMTDKFSVMHAAGAAESVEKIGSFVGEQAIYLLPGVEVSKAVLAPGNVANIAKKSMLLEAGVAKAEKLTLDPAHRRVAQVPDADRKQYTQLFGAGSAPPKKVFLQDYSQNKVWQEYAARLGSSAPPAIRPLRDFSNWMYFSYDSKRFNEASFTYLVDPKMNVMIDVNLSNSKMVFLIRAQQGRESLGCGSELFLSAFKAAHEHGYEINKVSADWHAVYPFTANKDQFHEAIKQGATNESAARQTFTGGMAERIGLPKVSFASEDLLWIDFSHPDWGAGKQMNAYSLAFTRAHGRDGIDVVPRLNASGEHAAKIKNDFMEIIYGLPVGQREVVLRQLHDNFAEHHEDILNDMVKLRL